MKCSKCSHLNEDEARYCNNCGFPLAENKKDWPSILLLAWCVSTLFFTVVWTIFGSVTEWIHSEYEPMTAIKAIQTINFVISSIQMLTYVVIPFAIPKTGLKIAAFAIVIVAIIWSIVRGINSLMSIYSLYA